jgi:hypothetical protein
MQATTQLRIFYMLIFIPENLKIKIPHGKHNAERSFYIDAKFGISLQGNNTY